MSEYGHDIQRLGAQLVAGEISEDYISEHFGDGILTQVLAFVAGGAIGGIAYDIARETPIIGDALDVTADIVDDVVGGFFDLF